MKTKNIEAYKLVICAKKTVSGNPWLNNFEKEINKRIGTLSGEFVKSILKVNIFEIQSSLDDFF